jgi:hypothetical protein
MRMWLVLCSSTDFPALWAYQGLNQLGFGPLELVLVDGLSQASRWEHRLDARGIHLNFTLADGRVIDASQIRGAVNRVLFPSTMINQAATPSDSDSDSDYIQAELHAFYLSWLKSLPGVVLNRPTATGLCGSWLHASEWALRAGRAGLTTRRYQQAARDSPEHCGIPPVADAEVRRVIAFDGQVFGSPVPRDVANGCIKLAQEVETALLGIDFQVDPREEWVFCDATPCPDLSLGGMPLLRSVARVLQEALP